VHHGSLPEQPGLQCVPCDATRSADVARVIAGQDAVVSLIGHVKDSPATVQTDAMRVLVASMQAANIRRLVSLTGTGVRLPGDRITLIDRVLNAAVLFVDKARVTDGRNHAAVLQESQLDWTVIRVLKLQNTAPKPFVLTTHGPTRAYVSREEVATAILDVLESGSFIRQSPIISKA
jgi:putative NADH-flavin reductase